MGDWDYGREHGLWGEDGIPYGIDDDYSNSIQSTVNPVCNDEIVNYISLMKEVGMTTIVAMNRYITQHELWSQFKEIRRENTYASGFTSIGISKEAYKSILQQFNTKDTIKTHLVGQNKV